LGHGAKVGLLIGLIVGTDVGLLVGMGVGLFMGVAVGKGVLVGSRVEVGLVHNVRPEQRLLATVCHWGEVRQMELLIRLPKPS
jgi:hypothetical protein